MVGTGTSASCTQPALSAALAAGGHITFNCGAKPATIVLSASYNPVLSAPAVVDGGGRITIDGAGVTRIFVVLNHPLTLQGLTLRNAKSPPTAQGGAVRVGPDAGASLTVDQVSFKDNIAQSGAAIWTAGGPVTIQRSTFSGHATAANGFGAVGADGPGTRVDIVNSTFEGAAESRGVLGATDDALMTLRHTTVRASANNAAALFASVNAILRVTNSVIVTPGPNVPVCAHPTGFGAAVLEIQAGNIRWGGAGASDACNLLNIPLADPKLGILRNNGGATHTMALMPGSAAMGAANLQSCTSHDQRGVARQGSCDSGAFQTAAATPSNLNAVPALGAWSLSLLGAFVPVMQQRRRRSGP